MDQNQPGRAARALAVTITLAAGLLAAAGTIPAAAAPAAAEPAAAAATAAPAATAPPRWIHLAAGEYFTCGIREGNTLWCWGRQTHGELGTGDPGNASLPQQITKKTAAWTSITAADAHACATRKDGSLWCWGYNGYGQIGVGTTADANRPQQVTTPTGDGWASVATGVDHTCAIRGDATLWCWGRNDSGELGVGSTTDQDLPQQVSTPATDGWASVSAIGATTCATRADGTLWCWGFNNSGQLGVGSTTNQSLPQQVTTPAAGGWATVTAGSATCATRSDTTLWCWGNNFSGQLGVGSTTNQSLPQQVTTPDPAGWSSVDVGYDHTCATRTHALWCWGYNGFGDLGIGGSTFKATLPQRVSQPGATGWTLIGAGGDHTCATRTGHALYCWGYNLYGQLGLGSTTQQNLPKQVTA